jgi:hypothetical protein
LIVGVVVAVAVILGFLIVYRSGRTPLALSPILEQRLLGIEAAIGRSDAIIREGFGRGRDETRAAGRDNRTFRQAHRLIAGLTERPLKLTA